MTDELTEARLAGATLDAVYQPPTFDAPKEGHGRWVALASLQGQEHLGVLWTGDNGSLGFIPQSGAGIQRVPTFYKAFSAAAAEGATAAEVFDHYAGLQGPGLTAGPVEEGDLDTLVY